jgi:hypothetical protein
MSKLPSTSNALRDVLDFFAFIAALATGTSLSLFGHLTAGAITTVCGAAVGPYVVWKHYRPVRDGDRPVPGEPSLGQDHTSGEHQGETSALPPFS